MAVCVLSQLWQTVKLPLMVAFRLFFRIRGAYTVADELNGTCVRFGCVKPIRRNFIK